MPAYATDADVAAIKNDVASIKSSTTSILSAIGSATSGHNVLYFLGQINSFDQSIYLNTNTIATTLGASNYGSVTGLLYDLKQAIGATGNQSSTNGLLYSLKNDFSAMINSFISPMYSDLHDLKSFFDNPSHEALEDASEDTVDEATSLTNTSIGGKTTAQSASSFGGMSSGLGQFFDTSIDADDMFSIFQNGDTGLGDGTSVFDFFSLDCALDMDSHFIGTRDSDPAKNPIIVTDYYGENQRAFERLKGGDSR